MTLATKFQGESFLIIAGASKAGTTSVFNYLANHPQICASVAKETRFFLDLDYPLPSELRSHRVVQVRVELWANASADLSSGRNHR